MTIIPDIYANIGSVLTDMQSAIGVTAFTANDVAERYAKKFGDEVKLMEDRRAFDSTSHTLEGYVHGMLSEYSKRAGGIDESHPAIEQIESMNYRFR